jgi:phenylacetate-coenzyme A ligase PaaK-like adenylate-forming protein
MGRRLPMPDPAGGMNAAPLDVALDWWGRATRTSAIWWTRQGGRAAVDAARAARLAALVAFARERSAFYCDAWRGASARDVAAGQVPSVTKRELMARFDDWVTDPLVTRRSIDAFLADRSQIGARYAGRLGVWKSSGSTGVPGVFVHDADALATYDALIAVQLVAPRLAAAVARGWLDRHARSALVAATGDHFASVASWRRYFAPRPWLDARDFSVLEPLPRLVAALNAYRPAFLASYPTLLALLAGEQRAGRLDIRPALLWSGGESLAPHAQAEVEQAFGCPLANEYGASECMSIAWGCGAGWLHVNADWVQLEPVDRDGRPVAPGVASHTVLLTNLANRVQPLIRYDLGDSITVNPDPCPCGSPLPAIRVEGRRDDVVTLVARDGRAVSLLPLALTTVLEDIAGIERFQLVQQAPDRLAVRLAQREPAERAVAWAAAARSLAAYLAQQGLANVAVVLDTAEPLPDSPSGKLRRVIVAMRR